MNRLPTDEPARGAAIRFVVIVDDDPSVRSALGRLLHSVGVESRVYDSAKRYLEADVEPAACLLLDIHLPEMSGVEVLAHLCESAPTLPVICMTGRDEHDLKHRVRAAGAHACLRKPFGEEELFEAISAATNVEFPR